MNKIEKLQSLMKQEQVDVCFITDTKAIQYYTGDIYSIGERLILLKVEQNGIPTLYLNQLFSASQNICYRVVYFSDTEYILKDILLNLENKTIAIDKNWQSHFLLEAQTYCKANYISGTIIDEVRALKQPDEIEKMIQASKLNDAVMEKVATLIQLGKSEKQLANEIHDAFKEIAGSEESFETIVAYGDHGADPHAAASNRILKEGEGIIVDMGCQYEHYCSDMTRTFYVNNNPDKEIYNLVLSANLAAEKIIKPGIRFKDIDKAARDVIEQAGYGQYFIHRLGHGIGLEVHEPFDVSATDEMIVKEGMCFSIEPGIYIPGKLGIRIEDLVCVTKDGCIVLNHYPKDKEILIR